MKNSISSKDDFEFKTPLIKSALKDQSKGLLYYAISVSLYGLSNFQMKLFRIWLQDSFEESSFIIFRSFPLAFIAYYLMSQNKEKIIKFEHVTNKGWFLVRMVSNYLAVLFYMLSVKYLRAATAATIQSLYPIIGILFAICILKEKFHMKYLIFSVIGFLCSLIMIINDKNYQDSKMNFSEKRTEDESQEVLNVFIGSVFGILSMLACALMVTSTKILINDKIDFKNQMFYLGISNTLIGCFSALLMLRLSLNIMFILLCFVNSVTVYYALAYMTIGLEHVDTAKVSPLAYLGIIVNFVLGALVLGEPIFLTDLLGSLVIVICNVYYSRMS